jgi:hypothetical protein
MGGESRIIVEAPSTPVSTRYGSGIGSSPSGSQKERVAVASAQTLSDVGPVLVVDLKSPNLGGVSGTGPTFVCESEQLGEFTHLLQ